MIFFFSKTDCGVKNLISVFFFLKAAVSKVEDLALILGVHWKAGIKKVRYRFVPASVVKKPGRKRCGKQHHSKTASPQIEDSLSLTSGWEKCIGMKALTS